MSKVLFDVCTFQEGYVNPSQKIRRYFGKEIKWLRTVDLNNSLIYDTSEHLSLEGYKSAGKSAYLFPEDSIAISKSGTIGELGIIKEKMCGNRAVINICVNKNSADLLYVFYLLKYKKKEIVSKAVGSIQKNLYISNLGTISINHDDIDAQKRISSILWLLDSKIINNKKINSEIELLAKTLYDYWFLQFDFPNEDGKPYKSSGGKMVYNDKLKREIPHGWEVKSVKDCIKSINTGLNPRNHFILNDGDIKYITVKNITTSGELDFSNCDTISQKSKDLINKRSMIDVGDILFASIAPLGRCYLIQEKPINWEINESVFSIKPNNTNLSEYLYMYFMSDYFIKKAEHSSTGSIFAGIRISTLENELLIIPSGNILDSFSNKVRPFFKVKNVVSKEIQELIKLRDFLLPLLMNGQVTIQDAEQQVNNTISNVWNVEKLLRFAQWKQMQGYAARGEVDEDTLMKIFDTMDKDAKK